MLQSLLAYARGAGVDARWLTIGGNEEFFEVTKRLHNRLHGAPGDGGELGKAEHLIYESALQESATELTSLLREGDVVYLHDPQTAGIAPHIKARRDRRRLALPRRARRPQRARAGGLGVPLPLCGGGRRLRLLAGGLRLGGPRARQDLDRPALDRRLLAQEPGDGPGHGHGDHGHASDSREDGGSAPVFSARGRVARPGRPAGRARPGAVRSPRTRRWSPRCRDGIGSRTRPGCFACFAEHLRHPRGPPAAGGPGRGGRDRRSRGRGGPRRGS